MDPQTTRTGGIVAAAVAGVTMIWLALPGADTGLIIDQNELPDICQNQGMVIPCEEYQRYVAWFVPPAIEPERAFSIHLSVKPVIYSWPIGTSIHAAKEVTISYPTDPTRGATDAVEVRFWMPRAWECAVGSMTARRRPTATERSLMEGLTPSSPGAKDIFALMSASVPSNEIQFGTCPDPMPERVPLAVPEPWFGLGLLAGGMLLILLGRLLKKGSSWGRWRR